MAWLDVRSPPIADIGFLGKAAAMGTLPVILLAIVASGQAHASPLRCSSRVGALAPTPEVARDIAQVVIRSRQSPERKAAYVLCVEQDNDAARKWSVWQEFPPEPPDKGAIITVRAGGGGIQMRIDKCTGEVSDVHYLR